MTLHFIIISKFTNILNTSIL